MTVIRTPVDLDQAVFWKLAAIAEAHDMKVPDYLAELAKVASLAKRPVAVDPVARLWREGFTDKQIAAELAMTNRAVSTRRRSFDLPANKHRTERNETAA